MMIIDTSAILAISFDESTADWVTEQLAHTDRAFMSTVNLAETVIRFRSRTPDRADELETELLASNIEFIPPDAAQAMLAARARTVYPLNFGDCFAYALAKTQNLPLLTLDRDFRATDIPLLLPPTA